MQIKSSKKLLFIFILFIFSLNNYTAAEEFNISAKEIIVDKDSEILTGKGSVEAIDKPQIIGTADSDTIFLRSIEQFFFHLTTGFTYLTKTG